jgi:hypothetical protein
MTTTLEAPTTLFATPFREREAGGARPTLEELLDATWRSANAHAQADCPMCRAPMRLEQGRARCEGCGTTLS